jgi:hypothetical protein
MACSEWNVPFLPVKPWQMTLVFLSIRMDIGASGYTFMSRIGPLLQHQC